MTKKIKIDPKTVAFIEISEINKKEKRRLSETQVTEFINQWNKSRSTGLCKFVPKYWLGLTSKDGSIREFRIRNENIKENNDLCYKLKNTEFISFPEKLSEKDEHFVNEILKQYGSAWEGGLPMLNKHFEVLANSKKDTIELILTVHTLARVQYQVTISRKDSPMSYSQPILPVGPELDINTLLQIELILNETKELWLIEPLNNILTQIKTDDGIQGIKDFLECTRFKSRLIDHISVLYFESNKWHNWFCLYIDTKNRVITEAHWIDLPPDHGQLLSTKELSFFNESLKKYGDFGVYGNVTAGLFELYPYFEISISKEKESLSFGLSPINGHGHWLRFDMNANTGEINGCAAGHYAPMPPPKQ